MHRRFSRFVLILALFGSLLFGAMVVPGRTKGAAQNGGFTAAETLLNTQGTPADGSLENHHAPRLSNAHITRSTTTETCHFQDRLSFPTR